MENPIKQTPLAAAVGNGVSQPLPVSLEEAAQRKAVADELRRLITLTEQGMFVSMIVTEETDTFPRQMKTGLWGDSETIRASAAQVLLMYEQRDRQLAHEPSPILMPEQQELIVPGVQR